MSDPYGCSNVVVSLVMAIVNLIIRLFRQGHPKPPRLNL